jgi:mannan endo-1,4-beta-mannosidase
MITRRALLAGMSALLASCAAVPTVPRAPFVRVAGTTFRKNETPYRIAGTNLWPAAYLGAGSPTGNRDRLRRELDRLIALGIDNVRILGSAEHSPLKNSVRPTFRDQSSNYNEALLSGLDYALAEMGRRDMRAVIYLTNFWEWSGGMMTYLYWNNGGRYMDMNDPAHPWPEFPDMSSEFYANAPAVAMYHEYVRAVVTRRNSITGIPYRDDPAIMSWQLANEPRPGGSDEAGRRHMAAYLGWIDATARLIKAADPNHLVSTGSEGTQGCIGDDQCVVNAHASPAVDYVTAHVWPQNWSWADPKDLAGTWPTTERKVRDYVATQVAIAQRLGKPLVIEEFGFPRDGGSFDPGTSTAFKDRFYQLIYGAVIDSVRSGGPLQGANFWAWGGEGRAQHPDHHFERGDPSYLGDPPHEPQGWYSVFDTDASTQAVIRAYASAVKAIA